LFVTTYIEKQCTWPLNSLGPHLYVKVPRAGNSEETFSVF